VFFEVAIIKGFGVYSAVFHSISAFCNAGFSLYSDSLTRWRSHWSVNLVFIARIMLGGMGFSMLTETVGCIRQWVFLRLKYYYSSAMVCRAASMVASIASVPWAADTNEASNWEGAR